MEPREKAAQLPDAPGVYIFKDAGGTVIYVGKATSLRSRARSYFLESRWVDAKTGSLAREIADLDTVVVGNPREALALEYSLIKRYRPKFNIMLRDDKTYPYIKLTAAEKYPRVYFTRRLKKDGSLYFGPFFPAGLARRILQFIHKRFLVPSCTVDLTRTHPRPCLQYYIKRCLGPCVSGLATDEDYAQATRDAKLFLEGRRHDLTKSLEVRMVAAAEKEQYEQAASFRDLIRTLADIEERQRIAAAQGDDTDVLAYYAEPPLVAANLFHLRGGRVVDRREFYWEDLEEFEPQEFVTSLLKQLYLESEYLPKIIHVPADFEERELLEETLAERAAHRVEIVTPQRGSKRAFLDLVENNARHSFEQRFRVLKPTSKTIAEAVQSALDLPDEPKRIESFDISHMQGTDTVASMVVWEDGRMKKSDYRKFIIRGEGLNNRFLSVPSAERLSVEHPPLANSETEVVSSESFSNENVALQNALGESGEASANDYAPTQNAAESRAAEKIEVLPILQELGPGPPGQNDDFASMREAVARRYRRVQEEQKPMPSLILIDGGIGQLHAAAQALDALQIINQPLASIAKKEEILYIFGREDEPCILDRHSPVLHLIQQIRDETHRFAVTFHRLRRAKRQTRSALNDIPGVGALTARKLLREFGSVANLRRADIESVSRIIPRKIAERILAQLAANQSDTLKSGKGRKREEARAREETNPEV
ncbi:MAG: excinuclease ABC subunit UvrC [Candidatus Acidiferrum sp.]|jgi:excinuclease ABC subunit C